MRRTSINLDSSLGKDEEKKEEAAVGMRKESQTLQPGSLGLFSGLVGKRQISIKDQGFTANR